MLMHVRELVLFLSSALSKMSCLLYILNKKSDHCFLNKNIFFVFMEEEANWIYKILWVVIFLSHLSQTFQPCGAYIFTLILLRWFGSFFSHLNFFILPKLLLLIKDLSNIYLQRCWCISHIWLCCLVTIIYFCFLAFSLE